MVRVILVRHGETVWNEEQRYQGGSDLRLSERGEFQAKRLAGRLASKPVGLIYSSDSKRALQTAAEIATHQGCQVRSDPRLREMDFGVWEGLTYSEIKERYPEALARWEGDPFGTAPPRGESLAQLATRVESVLDDIRKLGEAETVLVVSHGGPLRVLLCLALGLAPADHWRVRLDPGSVSELFLYSEGAILALLNDKHHLVEDRRGS